MRGGGAWADGERIHVSGVRRLEDAVVSFNDASLRLPGVLALAERSWHARAFGDFWAHMLVAEGAVDVCIDPVVSRLGPGRRVRDRRGGGRRASPT